MAALQRDVAFRLAAAVQIAPLDDPLCHKQTAMPYATEQTWTADSSMRLGDWLSSRSVANQYMVLMAFRRCNGRAVDDKVRRQRCGRDSLGATGHDYFLVIASFSLSRRTLHACAAACIRNDRVP